MTYTPQTWNTGVEGGTPLSATRLNYIEQGLAGVSADADGKAAINHTHSAAQTVSGVFAAARLPTATETASGIVERATEDEVITGTDTTRYVSPAGVRAAIDLRFKPTDPIPDPIAVFIGNSHTASGTWAQTVSTAQGWTPKVWAVGGTGFSYGGAGQYINQLSTGHAGLTTAERARVRIVVVSDCSNDSRGGASVRTPATTLFNQIKTNYPLARIILMPALWGSQGDNLTPTNITNLSVNLQELEEVSLMAGVEWVDWSWNWTWGRSDLMQASPDIHYTAAGQNWIAAWFNQYLKSTNTDYRLGWERMSVSNQNIVLGGADGLSTRRIGNDVTFTGVIQSNNTVAASSTVGSIGEGRRPKVELYVEGYSGGTSTPATVHFWIYPNGTIRNVQAMSAATYYRVNATFPTL